MKTIGILIMMLALYGSHAFANHYGMAGCGLGSIVFQDKPGMVQIFAATLNATGYQTIGITVGTSNCSEEASSETALNNFINNNKEALKKDISQGQGETLTSYLGMIGCQKNEAVGAVLQNNFKQIFNSNELGSNEITQNVKQVIRSNQTLAPYCLALI